MTVTLPTTPIVPKKKAKATPAMTLPKAIARLEIAPDARRLALAVLEVFAGVRTTTDAAKALSISLPRYYALEARAIEGLVRALEPRKRGRGRNTAQEVAHLKREKLRLERECARQQALTRAVQRTLGLASASPKKMAEPGAPRGEGRRRRERRPKPRALVAATALARGGAASEKPASTASPAVPRGTP